MDNDSNTLLQELMPLLNVLLGGVLVVAGGVLTSWWSDARQEKKLRKALAFAFEGEIRAILEVVRKRQYVEQFQEVLNRIRTTGQPEVFHFQAKREYFLVYKSNANSIGLLKPTLSRMIARFYTQANAILEDMDRVATADTGQVSVEEAIAFYEQLLSLMRDLLEIGEEAIKFVEKEYG